MASAHDVGVCRKNRTLPLQGPSRPSARLKPDHLDRNGGPPTQVAGAKLLLGSHKQSTSRCAQNSSGKITKRWPRCHLQRRLQRRSRPSAGLTCSSTCCLVGGEDHIVGTSTTVPERRAAAQISGRRNLLRTQQRETATRAGRSAACAGLGAALVGAPRKGTTRNFPFRHAIETREKIHDDEVSARLPGTMLSSRLPPAPCCPSTHV